MATYYVDVTTGSDADDGLSEANAWQTLQKAFDTATAGDAVYVKASATYSEQVDIDTNTGTVTAPITFVGYTSTITDGGQFTWNGTTYCAVTNGKDFIRFRNVNFTSCTGSIFDCITASSDYWRFENCDFSGATTVHARSAGYAYPLYWKFYDCCISGMSGNGLMLSSEFSVIGCKIIDNGGHGIATQAYVTSDVTVSHCIIAGNTSDGINLVNTSAGVNVHFCTIQGNGGDGIDLNGAGHKNANIWGNIISGHNGAGDVGLRAGTLSGTTTLFADWNFYYDNTTHQSGTDTTGTHDVTLTGDPFTNAAADNWTLNATAGGGAAVRSALQINFDATNIAYHDGGALQHQDAGGGGLMVHPGMRGGLRG